MSYISELISLSSSNKCEEVLAHLNLIMCFRIPLVGITVVGPVTSRLCSVCLRYDQGHQPSNSLSWGGNVTPGFPGTQLKAQAAGTQAGLLQNMVESL